MSKQKTKKKEFNLKEFLQSEEYQVKKEELNNELNTNTQMFNIELGSNRGSNKIPDYIETFKHNFVDNKRLKELKKNYKLMLNTPQGIENRSEFISCFVNSKQPNWNLVFKVIN